MTNDTTTLNGALQELGETMAANLTSQGVTASASDGLTTLAGKILQITPSPTTRTLSLSSNKNILSYYDSESATLTATLLEEGVGVSGETVEFFKGSTSLGTATTDSNGIATKSYTSTGAGDVSFTAGVGSLVSETYEIEDCTKYDTNVYLTHSNGDRVESLNYALPSTFRIDYEYSTTTTTNVSTKMTIGESSSRCVMVGRMTGSDTKYKAIVRTSSSGSGDLTTIGTNSIANTNEYIQLFVEYDGSSLNFNDDITVTNFNGVSLQKLVDVNGWHSTANRGMIRNIKIKPL